MNYRRFFVLLDGLQNRPDSLFWSDVQEVDSASMELIAITDVFTALTSQVHPLRIRTKLAEERKAFLAKKELIAQVAQQRKEAREYNAKLALEGQKNP